MDDARSTPAVSFGSTAFVSFVRLSVFGILAVAVFGKVQNAPAILSGDSLLSSWLILRMAVTVEIFVAACILFATRRTVWVMVVSLFSTFTVFATYEMLVGGGCQCFGRSLPSWMSLPIDIVVLGVMIGSRKMWRTDVLCHTEVTRLLSTSRNVLNQSLRRDVVAVATAVVTTVSVGSQVLPSLKIGRETGMQPDLRFLLAEGWIGQPWPINESFNESLSSLGSGEWLVLIFRVDCEHCVALVQELAKARAIEAERNARIATFVAGSDSWAVHLDDVSVARTGNVQVTWPRGTEPFVASPAAFMLDSGTIQDARDGKECREFVLKVLGVAAEPGYHH